MSTWQMDATPCEDCHREITETLDGWFRHSCVDRCGVWMPRAQEPCARKRGHAAEHRSAYSLDNLNWTRRSRVAA